MLGAVVLAAGLATRMGNPKMLLAWGKKTVIRHICDTLEEAGLNEIIVVAGGIKTEIEQMLNGNKVKVIYNPLYANGEMIDSLKSGLKALPSNVDAAIVVLGDQPFIKCETIKRVITAFESGDKPIAIPSINNKRGHPWIIHRRLWKEVLDIQPPKTIRDLFKNNQDHIGYVVINDPGIIQDMDTPEDYQKHRPDTASV